MTLLKVLFMLQIVFIQLNIVHANTRKKNYLSNHTLFLLINHYYYFMSLKYPVIRACISAVFIHGLLIAAFGVAMHKNTSLLYLLHISTYGHGETVSKSC